MDGNTYERVKEDYDKLKDNVVAEKKMYKFVKRTVDIIASIFGTILLVPITIIVCILNFFTKNKGPIFFVQETDYIKTHGNEILKDKRDKFGIISLKFGFGFYKFIWRLYLKITKRF